MDLDLSSLYILVPCSNDITLTPTYSHTNPTINPAHKMTHLLPPPCPFLLTFSLRLLRSLKCFSRIRLSLASSLSAALAYLARHVSALRSLRSISDAVGLSPLYCAMRPAPPPRRPGCDAGSGAEARRGSWRGQDPRDDAGWGAKLTRESRCSGGGGGKGEGGRAGRGAGRCGRLCALDMGVGVEGGRWRGLPLEALLLIVPRPPPRPDGPGPLAPASLAPHWSDPAWLGPAWRGVAWLGCAPLHPA
jgi:hypothetical protein